MSPKIKAIAVKYPKIIVHVRSVVSREIFKLPIAVWLIFLFTLLSRIPLLLNDLPPYQFCDENIYQNETIRMIYANDWIPNEFRAGGFNIYPAFLLFNLINSILPIPLNALQMLIIGRIFYALLLPAISILIVFKISSLFVGKVSSTITTFLFSVSTLLYSNFWYPDTYIQFGISGFLYFALKIFMDRDKSVRSYICLGIFLAVAVSTKYTALVLLVPTFFLLGYVFYSKRQKNIFWKSTFITVSIFLFLTLLLNNGVLLRTTSFIDGFTYNLNNYGSTIETRYDGFLYYAAILLVNSFTVFGFLYFVIGLYLSRRKMFFLLILGLYPLILVLLLGDKIWVIARNMTSASVFLIPFVALGVGWVMSKLESSSNAQRKFASFLLASSVFVPLISYGYLIDKDMSTDTRISAAQWISSNIDEHVVVGVNEFCSGESPAKVVGNAVISDPSLTRNLDYYVLNSYWSNPFSSRYLEKGVLTLIDQSKIHFEQFNSTKLVGSFGPVHLTEEDHAQNYKIIKLIQGNGPDIIILKKITN
jgi:hypothetical protein